MSTPEHHFLFVTYIHTLFTGSHYDTCSGEGMGQCKFGGGWSVLVGILIHLSEGGS